MADLTYSLAETMGYDKTICNFIEDHVYFSARRDAGIAQLVEHLLAKEKVASSSLVSRSKSLSGWRQRKHNL